MLTMTIYINKYPFSILIVFFFPIYRSMYLGQSFVSRHQGLFFFFQ